MTNVRIFSRFEEMPEEAARVFSAAASQSFFLGLPWFRTFANYALDAGDEVRIYSAFAPDAGNSLDLAIPALHKSRDSRFLRPRKLTSLTSYYSCFYSPICAGALSRQSAMSLVNTMARESPRWDQIELKPLDVNSEVFQLLLESFRNAGFVVQTYFCFGNWYLDVKGRDFSQYLDSLPSVLRNTLNRKKKKLEKSARSKIEIITGDDGLEPAIEAYNKIYSSSWKQEEPYPQFVPELIRTCARAGALRLGVLSVDGEPAAAQFWMVHNKNALIYKLAYDSRFADLSVGTILTAALMEHAMDVDRVSEVDYLSGDDAYKRDWMSGRRERWGILAMNPRTLLGALAIARHVGGRAIKRSLQAISKRIWKPGMFHKTADSSASL